MDRNNASYQYFIDERLNQRLSKIEENMEAVINGQVQSKELLTVSDVAVLLGLSESYIYKLTAKRAIPHYKPNGKLVYFNRSEIIGWVMRNPVNVLQPQQAELV